MWQEQVDEEGRSVTRSFGLPTTDVEYYTYNKGNNPQGTYRIGVFDSQGHPTPPPRSSQQKPEPLVAAPMDLSMTPRSTCRRNLTTLWQ